jgi:hypothetical protein
MAPPTPPNPDHRRARAASVLASDGTSDDLAQLLHTRGLEHWHSLLLAFMDRYSGWLQAYEFEPSFDPDYRPLGEVIDLLLQLPARVPCDDLAFAVTLTRCDFLMRTARDMASGAAWDARALSYQDFVRQHPRAEPLWAIDLPWPADEFASWAMSRLRRPPRTTCTPCTPSTPPPDAGP